MSMRKLMAGAAVAASAAIPMAANAATEDITFEANGYTWRARLEPEADPNLASYGSEGEVPGTAMLGINPSCEGLTDRDNLAYKAIADVNVTVDASLIPWEFDYNGTHYTVTKIALGAFRYKDTAAKLNGTVTIPDSVTEIRNHAFNNQTTLTGFSGGRNVKFWGNTTGGGVFSNCQNMGGVYPNMSQSVAFGDSIFQTCKKMTGSLVFSDMLQYLRFGAFQDTQISGAVVIPASADVLGDGNTPNYGIVTSCPKLEAIWVKGKPTAESQTHTTVYCASFAKSSASMKMILMGKNTKGVNMTQAGSNAMLYGDSGVQVFVPANGYWDGLVTGGSNNKVWYYGPGQEFDLEVDDETMTATVTPTTVNAFTNALTWVSGFRTYFNLSTCISIPPTIDLTDVTITEDMVRGLPIFSAKTQAQLDGILAAFPASAQIAIDPTGLTENMVIPDGYPNVFVKTVPGVTIRRTSIGFKIIVR